MADITPNGVGDKAVFVPGNTSSFMQVRFLPFAQTHFMLEIIITMNRPGYIFLVVCSMCLGWAISFLYYDYKLWKYKKNMQNNIDEINKIGEPCKQ